MFGEIAGAIGDLIGLSQQEDFEDAAHQRAQQNIELQREFARHGISWKVEDAKEAGLHPLFAVGGSGAAFAPNPIVLPEQPQVGRALRSAGTAVDQWRGQQAILDGQAAATDKDRAIADFYRSEAARARANTNSAKPVIGDPSKEEVIQGTPNVSSPMSGYYDRRIVQANPTFSRDSNFSSVGAGSSPAFRSYELMPGKVIDLPHTEEGPSEALENLTVTSWPFVIAHNIAHYGPEWLKDMASIITPFVEGSHQKSRRARGADMSEWY